MLTIRFGVNSAASRRSGDHEGVRTGLGQAFASLRHFWCGLHGHEPLLQFDRDRIFLQCASCGFETSGWEVGEGHARPQAHRTSRYAPQPQLADVRKVA